MKPDQARALIASIGSDEEFEFTAGEVRRFRDMALEFKAAVALVRSGDEPVDHRIILLDPASDFFTLAQLGAQAPAFLARISALEQELAEARGEWKPTHQHYKGGLYRFITAALREGDLEPLVVYEPEDGPVFVRPMSEFREKFTGLPGTDFRIDPPLLSRDVSDG